jgi:hypothetical protein
MHLADLRRGVGSSLMEKERTNAFLKNPRMKLVQADLKMTTTLAFSVFIEA